MSDDTVKECRVEEYKVSDILDYGQGYDDTILELLKAFNQFKDGYYSLINYGDDWWKNFNQSSMFDEMMSEAWDKIEGKNFKLMDSITKMFVTGNFPSSLSLSDVTYIGGFAFYNCSALTSVTFP